MIKSAANTPLNMNPGTLPDVSSALYEWLQNLYLLIVTKTVVNSEVVETYVPISFSGVWQPMGAEQIKLKPEGQRSWQWYTCHTLTGVNLINDQIIKFQDENYRVMSNNHWSQYGYWEYHLVKDYTGAGPTEATE